MEVKPGYKQTEVGVIPEDWEVKLLFALADIRSGGTPSTSEPRFWDGDIPWCTPTDITALNGHKYLGETARMITQLGLKASSAEVIPAHSVVMTSRATIGECAINVVPIATNQGFKNFVPSAATDVGYLYYLLGTQKQRFISLCGGSTFLEIGKTQLAAYKVQIPSKIVEQRAIAAALSDVDALLGGLDRLIAKKRDLKQAAMQQLLTGQTRLPGFSGAWEVLNMAQKSLLKARIGWQGLTTAEYLATGSYYLVTGTDFSTGRVNWATCPFVAADRYEQDHNIQLRAEDVLVTKDGTIGKVAFVDELPGPATLNSGVFVIRPKANAYQPRFLYYILASAVFEDFLRKLAAGSTISHLYQKDFVSFEFTAPPSVEEQTAIAAVLSDMDAELASLEARRDKTRDLKQAMMQELLTGKTRLVKPEAAHA